MRKTSLLMFTLALVCAANAFAMGEARLTGKIVDADTKQPIANATVRVVAAEQKKYDETVKAKKDGSYAIFVLDGTIRYKLTYSAPGYNDYVETVKLKLGEQNVKDVDLGKGGSAPAAAAGAAAPAGADPATVAYNEGVLLLKSGDRAGAIKKFEAAVAANADLMAGWSALAKTQLREKNYAAAIAAANKVVDIDDSDAEMWSVLVESYTATGDKAKAAEAQKKLPANAVTLFNDAAKLINANNDAEAEKLLKQAIAIDPKMAQSYYELGMLYARASKNGDAREMLQKYLEIAPDGKDAATAKEMLNYIK
ncbi:MAG TPA: tetratricopeptide repeat protein [Thermoanaerobaculia bacterium]|jgi:tetratricopeptide (TPR) repeat protein